MMVLKTGLKDREAEMGGGGTQTYGVFSHIISFLPLDLSGSAQPQA